MKKTIRIRTDQVIARPDPKMWGIFYEEINHAGDGGIYAELIRNRNFAEALPPENTIYANGKIRTANGHTEDFDRSDLLPGWQLRPVCGGMAMMDLTEENPRNPECPCQLKLGVMDAAEGIRLVNSGYWGIACKKQQYYGFIIARSEGIRKITVGLMYSGGTEICSCTLPVTESFEKLPFVLDCPASAPDVRFFIKVQETGILYLDFVTLFPQDTDLNRPYGLRKDLMDMLRGLHPGFVRFPGGCVVEGITLDNAIHWKKTRGPIEDRPGHWDLWHYRATDGLGMLEFCQMAEDLGADIMYVANCGMSCQFRKSEYADEAGIDWWLQNAMDGIDYICGDTSTEYGALRAKDGHPAPFALRYVEIGNENINEVYHIRYKKFYAALKEKYPQLTLIATQKVPDAPMDMVDDHYYTAPQFFPNNYNLYEGEGTPVYVGEYATNQEVGYGNLLGAVSDAVFMTGMENCSNRVRIASFAPLFCNDHDRTWPVNLINFDNSRVFGIPSYYVQQLFGEYRVDVVCGTDNHPEKNADSSFHVTAGKKDDTLIIKAANFGSSPVSVTFCPEEEGYVFREGKLLASENPQDTNSLSDPQKVVPVCVEAENSENGFRLILPPDSFAVLIADKKQ